VKNQPGESYHIRLLIKQRQFSTVSPTRSTRSGGRQRKNKILWVERDRKSYPTYSSQKRFLFIFFFLNLSQVWSLILLLNPITALLAATIYEVEIGKDRSWR